MDDVYFDLRNRAANIIHYFLLIVQPWKKIQNPETKFQLPRRKKSNDTYRDWYLDLGTYTGH